MFEVRDAGRVSAPNRKAALAAGAGSHLAPEAPSIRSLHQPGRAGARKKPQPIGGSVKRAFDVAFSAIALASLALPMGIIALLIKLDSKGPVFFVQRRGGFRGKPFLIYKFRTMTACDDGKAITQATQQDTRITKLGAFLRKTSLDELPQFINVLNGDMSLIGPRPHALAHDQAFAEIDPSYRKRFRARPGITGLAQVSGHRGLTATADAVRGRTARDVGYVEQYSLWLDFTIFVRTLFLFLRDKNAF